MVIVRFRNDEEHGDMLKKIKKMKRFTEELEDCFENAYDDDRVSYHKDYDEDEGRYGYRRGVRRY